MSEWQPISTAPIDPFDESKWYKRHSDNLLLWDGGLVKIGSYGFTKNGKGRWQWAGGNFSPTHWMPLPEAPAKATE